MAQLFSALNFFYMNKLVEQVLTDRSVRNAEAMKSVALENASEVYAPWAN